MSEQNSTAQKKITLLFCVGFILLALGALIVLIEGIENTMALIPVVISMVVIVSAIFLRMKSGVK